MAKSLTLGFVSPAFNESKSLHELHIRCCNAYEIIKREFPETMSISYRFIIADNCSVDGSAEILEEICKSDPNVEALINHTNYGPEASAVNALHEASDCDLIILLCSDLQDPPELSIAMVQQMMKQPELDAVLAVKESSAGNTVVRIGRRSYYKALSYSTRLQHVPSGFHGFGCYRRDTIRDAIRYWDCTDLNLRQCLANASQFAMQVNYKQANRLHGKSSYSHVGYWKEALQSLASGDAAGSRIAVTIGTASLIAVFLISISYIINVIATKSGDGQSMPTVLTIMLLLSFALQMIMLALISRQVEALRMAGIRKQVRFRRIAARKD